MVTKIEGVGNTYGSLHVKKRKWCILYEGIL